LREYGLTKPRRSLQDIEQHQQHKTTILVIDEAQTLRPPLLELLRLENSAGLQDRVTIYGALTSLTRQDCDDLIAFRFYMPGGKKLPFSGESLEVIFRYSQGYPRQICRLCDNALIRAFSHGLQTIDGALIQSVVEEIHLTEPSEPIRQKAGRKPRQAELTEEENHG
jgi:type II secretory pathway predicted ATPase ExeA